MTENKPNPSKIIIHKPREESWSPPAGEEHINQISDHIERHIGPIKMVFHEIISDLVHIDVHHIEPTDNRPWHTLVTSGMSDLPMAAPEGMNECKWAELIIELPPEWPLDKDSWANEEYYWPIRWIKTLARMPHEYKTWLWYGHTIPNGGSNPVPFAENTKLSGMMLTFPYSLSPDFFKFTVKDGKSIHFWSLWPLYKEEMAFKIKNGAEALEEKPQGKGISSVIDPERANVCKKFLGLF